jgi:hypothetical protein
VGRDALPSSCDAPDVRVLVPATVIALGPSDWEAEGRVAPRVIHTQAFRIDAFEATRARYDAVMGGAARQRGAQAEAPGEPPAEPSGRSGSPESDDAASTAKRYGRGVPARGVGPRDRPVWRR